jgi:hypothetical protein
VRWGNSSSKAFGISFADRPKAKREIEKERERERERERESEREIGRRKNGQECSANKNFVAWGKI